MLHLTPLRGLHIGHVMACLPGGLSYPVGYQRGLRYRNYPRRGISEKAARTDAFIIPGPPHALEAEELASFFKPLLTHEAWRWCATVSLPEDEKKRPVLTTNWLVAQTTCPTSTLGLHVSAQEEALPRRLTPLTLPEALWVTLIGLLVLRERWFESAKCRTSTHVTRNQVLCVGWRNGKIAITKSHRDVGHARLGMAGKIPC